VHREDANAGLGRPGRARAKGGRHVGRLAVEIDDHDLRLRRGEAGFVGRSEIRDHRKVAVFSENAGESFCEEHLRLDDDDAQEILSHSSPIQRCSVAHVSRRWRLKANASLGLGRSA